MTTTEILTGIKDWVLSKLSLKQDVINDLAAIRRGSQAGSTAVQPSDLSSYFNNASYDTNTHRINFYHGQNIVAYVDASPFIIDGMVNDVRIENGYLVIDFNTDSGKQDISIPLTDIFDPNNYYNKTQTDRLLAQKQDVIQDLASIRSGASAGATAVQPETLNSELSDTVAESGVYDVTINNDNTKFASLSALLSSENLDTLIPSDKRKGGMSIKFVQSSDNKYVKFFCTANEFTTDVTKWQGVDSEISSSSKNLIESGGVYNVLKYTLKKQGRYNISNGVVIYLNDSNKRCVHFQDLDKYLPYKTIKYSGRTSQGIISVITTNRNGEVIQELTFATYGVYSITLGSTESDIYINSEQAGVWGSVLMAAEYFQSKAIYLEDIVDEAIANSEKPINSGCIDMYVNSILSNINKIEKSVDIAVGYANIASFTFKQPQAIKVLIDTTATITSNWISYRYLKEDGTYSNSLGFNYDKGLTINEEIKAIDFWISVSYPCTAAGIMNFHIYAAQPTVVNTDGTYLQESLGDNARSVINAASIVNVLNKDKAATIKRHLLSVNNSQDLIKIEDGLSVSSLKINISTTAVITSSWVLCSYKNANGQWVDRNFNISSGCMIAEKVTGLRLSISSSYPVTTEGDMTITLSSEYELVACSYINGSYSSTGSLPNYAATKFALSNFFGNAKKLYIVIPSGWTVNAVSYDFVGEGYGLHNTSGWKTSNFEYSVETNYVRLLISKAGYSTDITPQEVANNIKVYGILEEETQSVFKGRMLATVGDSITYGTSPDNDPARIENPWPKIVANKLGFGDVSNQGVASARVLGFPAPNTPPRIWSTQYNVVPASADIISVMVGINDMSSYVSGYQGYVLGQMSDRDGNSFYGGLHMMWRGLIDRFPPKNGKKLFMIQYPKGDAFADNVWNDWMGACEKVANYYGIPILDLSKELGISQYYEVTEDYWILNNDEVTHNQHPTQLGAEQFAIAIANFISRTFSIK